MFRHWSFGERGSHSGPRVGRWRGLRLERLEDRSLLTAAADLTAYRPINEFIDYLQHPVPEAVEADPTLGPGIRANGDDDNGNRRADYLDSSTKSGGDNDLVRVDVVGAGDSLVIRWTGPLAVWTSPTKAAAVHRGDAVVNRQSLWVEYASLTHTVGDSATLTLAAREAATDSLATDTVVLHSFQSIVIAIGGST